VAMTRRQARSCALALAYGRIVIGTGALVAPGRVLRPWLGPDAGVPAVGVVSRGLGARDVALGLGAILAMRHRAPARGWIEAGGLADGGDLVATLVAFGRLPRRGRWAVAAAAATAVAAARLAAASVD
jgi:hypothetical protein